MKVSSLKIVTIFLIVFAGMFLRNFNLEKKFLFDADQENFAWTAVRIIEEKRPVLIGLKAGEFPIFIGPMMYYIYSLFFFLFSMDPSGLSYLSLFLSFFTLVSVFLVAKKVFGERVGIFSLLIYAFSFLFIEFDRRAWLPGPLILTSIWVFYALYRLNKKEQTKWLVILGLLFSFGFQLHITALFFWPIVILGILVKKIRLRRKSVVLGVLSGISGVLPVFLFDLRHNFLNFKGWLTLFNRTGGKINFLLRAKDLFRYTLESELRIFPFQMNQLGLAVSFLVFVYWFTKSLKTQKGRLALRLAFLWVVVPILVFLPINIHTPEYYFIISFPILVLVSAFLLKELAKKRLGKVIAPAFLIIFTILNVKAVLNEEAENLISLYQKKKTIEYILQKAKGENFSVFYEADRGLQYGLDYLFYWKLGKVPEKKEEADFAIVVPWNYKNLKISKRFGAIGLIDEFIK